MNELNIGDTIDHVIKKIKDRVSERTYDATKDLPEKELAHGSLLELVDKVVCDIVEEENIEDLDFIFKIEQNPHRKRNEIYLGLDRWKEEKSYRLVLEVYYNTEDFNYYSKFTHFYDFFKVFGEMLSGIISYTLTELTQRRNFFNKLFVPNKGLGIKLIAENDQITKEDRAELVSRGIMEDLGVDPKFLTPEMLLKNGVFEKYGFHSEIFFLTREQMEADSKLLPDSNINSFARNVITEEDLILDLYSDVYTAKKTKSISLMKNCNSIFFIDNRFSFMFENIEDEKNFSPRLLRALLNPTLKDIFDFSATERGQLRSVLIDRSVESRADAD